MSRKLLLILVWLLGGLSVSQWAQAQVSLTCQVPTASDINFGTVDWTSANVTVNGTVNLRCTNSSGFFGVSATICFSLNAGSGGSSSDFFPRLLSKGSGVPMQYQIYEETGLVPWTNPAQGGALQRSVTVPPNQTSTVSVPFQARLSAQQWAPAGGYISLLQISVDGSANIGASFPTSCLAGGAIFVPPPPGQFTAFATVQNRCVITAMSGINFGAGSSNIINAMASGTLALTCTAPVSYTIGLSPSNNNTGGAGVMTGSIGGNTDKVPYQLSSTPGPAGTPWGDVIGNRVSGVGNSASQLVSIYATVPSANYRPDTYKDTVTVRVYY